MLVRFVDSIVSEHRSLLSEKSREINAIAVAHTLSL